MLRREVIHAVSTIDRPLRTPRDSLARRLAKTSKGARARDSRGRRCGGSLWSSFAVSARRWRQRRNLRNHLRDESTDSHRHGLPRAWTPTQPVPQTSSAGTRCFSGRRCGGSLWTSAARVNRDGAPDTPIESGCRRGGSLRRSFAVSARRWRQRRNLRNHGRQESTDSNGHGLPQAWTPTQPVPQTSSAGTHCFSTRRFSGRRCGGSLWTSAARVNRDGAPDMPTAKASKGDAPEASSARFSASPVASAQTQSAGISPSIIFMKSARFASTVSFGPIRRKNTLRPDACTIAPICEKPCFAAGAPIAR